MPSADLRVRPREHQMLHVISTISMKLYLLQHSKKQNGSFFGYFRGKIDPLVFRGFNQRNRFSIRKFMKTSLQCYLTDYPGRLYTYCSILNKCTTQVSVNLTYSLSRQINDCFFFFLTFRFIQIFDNFEVKYLPLPESYNNNLIPRYNPLLRF